MDTTSPTHDRSRDATGPEEPVVTHWLTPQPERRRRKDERLQVSVSEDSRPLFKITSTQAASANVGSRRRDG
jgi:hypothetical protein